MVIDSALNRSTVAEIQRDVNRQKGRNRIYRFICARANKDTIAEWWAELPRILQIFQVGSVGYAMLSLTVRFQIELSIKAHVEVEEIHVKVEETHVKVEETHANVEGIHVQVEETHVKVEETHVQVKEIHKAVLEIRDGQNLSVSCAHSWQLEKNAYSCPASNQVSSSGFQGILYLTFDSSILPGESPPPAPRNLFGRDELIEKVVGLAENMEPIALIGFGGIGKSSIALTVLHCDRIKKQFGESRRFIRCNEFNPSRTNFLRRLSEVIGAGIDNPEGLAPLRSFLTSKEMFIVLDNAESILDQRGPDAQEIYKVVEELSLFPNICLCITSRIRTIPPCKRLDVPTMSMGAARSAFYSIHDNNNNNEQPDIIDDILTQVDFHPLSVTLLATVAQSNGWDNDRLAKEWGLRQTGVLQKGQWKDLAAAIELSLASPTFEELGPDARGILQVIAFFPQGVNENDCQRLFPTVSDGNHILDELCVLSLTYRSGGFVTMLAPIRDHLGLKDQSSSPLLLKTKEYYFTRISVEIECHIQGSFDDSRWIASEDANVEHLIDVFTTIDPGSDEVWKACANFMKHLHWHKQRKTVLGPKVEALPDSHPLKALCLFELSRVFLGSDEERRALLSHVVELEKGRGDSFRIALTSLYLSDVNLELGLYEEGMQRAREALAIAEPSGIPVEIAGCLNSLAWSLCRGGRVDDAEEAATRALSLLPEKGQEYMVCQSHQILGEISFSRDKREEAIRHFEDVLRIASPFGWHTRMMWIHHSLALLFSQEGKFDDAQTHIKQAESYAAGNLYLMGRTVLLQALVFYQQRMFAEATSEASRALEVFQKLGSTKRQEICEALLRKIDQAKKGLSTGESDRKFQW